MFAFLYVKANSKEICEEISFPSFLLGFKANYLEKAWLPLFFFVDSNSPCKDLLYPRGPNLAQKPLYLVGTVLNLPRNIVLFQVLGRCFAFFTLRDQLAT